MYNQIAPTPSSTIDPEQGNQVRPHKRWPYIVLVLILFIISIGLFQFSAWSRTSLPPISKQSPIFTGTTPTLLTKQETSLAGPNGSISLVKRLFQTRTQVQFSDGHYVALAKPFDAAGEVIYDDSVVAKPQHNSAFGFGGSTLPAIVLSPGGQHYAFQNIDETNTGFLNGDRDLMKRDTVVDGIIIDRRQTDQHQQGSGRLPIGLSANGQTIWLADYGVFDTSNLEPEPIITRKTTTWPGYLTQTPIQTSADEVPINVAQEQFSQILGLSLTGSGWSDEPEKITYPLVHSPNGEHAIQLKNYCDLYVDGKFLTRLLSDIKPTQCWNGEAPQYSFSGDADIFGTITNDGHSVIAIHVYPEPVYSNNFTTTTYKNSYTRILLDGKKLYDLVEDNQPLRYDNLDPLNHDDEDLEREMRTVELYANHDASHIVVYAKRRWYLDGQELTNSNLSTTHFNRDGYKIIGGELNGSVLDLYENITTESGQL